MIQQMDQQIGMIQQIGIAYIPEKVYTILVAEEIKTISIGSKSSVLNYRVFL